MRQRCAHSDLMSALSHLEQQVRDAEQRLFSARGETRFGENCPAHQLMPVASES